jgi:hypothetical protein
VIVVRGDMGGRWVEGPEDEDHVRIPDIPGVSLDQIEVDGCLLRHSFSMPSRTIAVSMLAVPYPRRLRASRGAPTAGFVTTHEGAVGINRPRARPTNRRQRLARRSRAIPSGPRGEARRTLPPDDLRQGPGHEQHHGHRKGDRYQANGSHAYGGGRRLRRSRRQTHDGGNQTDEQESRDGTVVHRRAERPVMARTVGRGLTALAALALLSSIVLALLPNPGTAVIIEPNREVNCGNMFVQTTYRGDDGCEGPYLARSGWIVLLSLVALPIGATGLLLLRRAVRYG